MVTFKTRYYTILHFVSQIKKLHISRRQFSYWTSSFGYHMITWYTNVFGRILLMEKIPKTHHLGCYWNPAVNFMGFQLPNFPPSTGWWVGPELTHQTQDPMSAVILDDGFSMLTGEDVKKRCRWRLKIPDFGQRVEHQPVEPFCRTLVLVGKSCGFLGVDHQK